MSKYQNEVAFPLDWTRSTTNKEERRYRILGARRNYQLNLVLYKQEKKVDPRKKEDMMSKQIVLPKVPKPGR